MRSRLALQVRLRYTCVTLQIIFNEYRSLLAFRRLDTEYLPGRTLAKPALRVLPSPTAVRFAFLSPLRLRLRLPLRLRLSRLPFEQDSAERRRRVSHMCLRMP